MVPINYYANNTTLDTLFDSLNGFFFVGGGAEFPESAQHVFDRTVKANANGDYMPLWGTCMGFQWLLMSATRDSSILDPKGGAQFDSENISLPLSFTSAAASSKLFGSAPADVVSILKLQNVTMNNHHYGIYPDHFAATPALASFFNVLSTNVDRAGSPFVSTIESKQYPIFGSQWHPEKNAFEWSRNHDGTFYEAINHSPDAIKVGQWAANFFVDRTRQSVHRFASLVAENEALIYNYAATRTDKDFISTYFFPNDF